LRINDRADLEQTVTGKSKTAAPSGSRQQVQNV
jgi:hypothetical protein